MRVGRDWRKEYVQGFRNESYDEAFAYMAQNIEVEPQVCRHFGCGTKLRSQEIVCGGYCVHHQKRENMLDLVGKYISK